MPGPLPSLKSIIAKPGAAKSATSSADELPSLRQVLGNGTAKLPSLKDVLSGKAGAVAPEKHGRGGFLGTIEHVVTQTPKDLANAALQSPGGLAHAVNTGLIQPQYNELVHGPDSPEAKKARARSTEVGKGMVKQTVDTVKHPLRHPGDTLLLVASGGLARSRSWARLRRCARRREFRDGREGGGEGCRGRGRGRCM
jgi:hypothetical protein